jgi:DNA helicase-2/ATP-dependent DNA helicase PcrA
MSLLHQLQDLVLSLNLPEPEYFWTLPGGLVALLAYPEHRAAMVSDPGEAAGWRLVHCDPASAAAVEEAVRALGQAIGALTQPHQPAGGAARAGASGGAGAAGEAWALEATVPGPAVRPGPTPRQRLAIEHGEGPARILAGAGTGKTTVIVGRFHHLVAGGVKPDRILTLTFSREAARSLRDQILPDLPAAPQLWVSTFHSFCLKMLEAEGQLGLRLMPEAERRLMLGGLCEGQAWTYYGGSRWALLVPEALTFIGQAKDYLLTPDDVERYAAEAGDARLTDLARAYRLYQTELARQQAAEFSDFILRAARLMETDPAVAKRWQDRFDHILVDEFQDTNLAQFRLLQQLAGPKGNLVVVGDDDQAIYRFRGASDRYLLRLPDTYPQARTYQVEENFRCPQVVLDVANRLIAFNGPDRVAKQLTSHDKHDGFPAVAHWEAQNEREEAEAVAAEIARRVQQEGKSPADFAILCRSLRRSGGEFARALARRAIPYRMVGEESAHPVVAQTLALLRLTRGLNTPDLLPVLAGRLGAQELYAALRAAQGNLAALAEAPGAEAALAPFRQAVADLQDWINTNRNLPLPDIVYQALKYLGHLSLSLSPTSRDVDRLMAARSLQERAAEAPTLDAFLADCARGTGRTYAAPGDAVTLMTIHAAKGLQFPVVFVTALAEGLFPVAVDSTPVFYTAEVIRDWLDQPGAGAVPDPGQRLLQHVREERRLAYVALTRAERELILTRAKQYGQETAPPSRFLAEMGAPLAEGVAGRIQDPIPDARSYLVGAATGTVRPEPDRFADAARLLSVTPHAVPLRRQESPRPFGDAASLKLSATALEAYRDCPRRYYYAQVLRLPDEDNIALAFGDAMHSTLELYHKALKAGRRPTDGDLAEWWRTQLDRGRCETEGQYRQLLGRGDVFLRRYAGWAPDHWQEIISAEDRFEVPWADGSGRTHRLVGRYDLIARGPDGTVEIIDFKTGHRKGGTTVNKRPTKDSPNNADRKLQLGLYYLAYYGGEVDPKARVTYIFLRHVNDKYPAAFVETFNEANEQVIGCSHTADSLQRIRQETNDVIAGILANRFDRTDDESKCYYCPFRDVCEVTPHDWF